MIVKMKTEKCSFGKPFLSKRFVGIAIVLSLLFLVVLPTIAAEDDFVLGVYGNANEDDTIDMRDLTYVKLIFFGEKQETELADAKYDGEIDPLDFVQIKLVIVGKEKELTLVDSADRIVTVKKPVERVIVFHEATTAAMRSIKAADKIVGVDKYTLRKRWCYPEFKDFPNVGYVTNPNYEEILNCDPDVVFLFGTLPVHKIRYEEIQNTLNELDPTTTVIGFDFVRVETYVDEIRMLGYIMDKENEACEFIDFYNEWMDKIKERTGGLSEGDKPKIYFEEFSPLSYHTYGTGTLGLHGSIVAAGGNNIFGDRAGFIEVDAEAVIDRDPDVILKYEPYARSSTDDFAYDPAKMDELREEILNRPELQNVTAVKDERVYIITNEVLIGGWHLVGISYMAKWFHPELFSDIDPKAIHQEYITRFQEGFDYNLNELGAFVYPES